MPHCTESYSEDTGLVCLVQIARFHQIAHEHGTPSKPFDADSLVGERGAPSGQRNRSAIAWALTTSPSILIPDKATSALDYASERIIRHNIRAICNGRTLFIITHRLSAVRHADRILVVDEGRVFEQGGHDAPLKSRGISVCLHAMPVGLAVNERSRPSNEPPLGEYA